MKLPILFLVLSSVCATSLANHLNKTNSDGEDTVEGRCHDEASKIQYKLFTRKYTEQGKIISADDPSSLKLGGFEPSLKTIILIHGWLSNQRPTFSGFRLKDVIFNRAQNSGEYYNIILVDWSAIDTLLYWVAADKVSVVGNQTARIMRQIADTFNYDANNFHIIGHSLGAHIAGTTTRSFGSTAPLITGLDPAGPLFNPGNPLRLTSADSRNVVIIYTCGGFLSIPDGMGHTNIFPTGGVWPQPGCYWDIRGVCSHCRSYLILAEMILNKGIQVTRCKSYTDFKKGLCADNIAENIYFLFPSKTPRGNFYFWGNPSPPFCPSSRVTVDRDWDKTSTTVGC